MKLAIIAANPIILETLKNALSGLDLNVCTYSSREEMQAQKIELAVCVFDDVVEWPEDSPCFALFGSSAGVSKGQQANFISCYQMPVRLGRLVESIQSYVYSRKQKDLMKPISMGDFVLDPKINSLKKNKAKSSFKLTEKEQDMLLFLHALKGKSASRQDLLDNVWGYAEGVETHTLETHIYRLRQKIETDPTTPDFLMTSDDGYFLKL